MVSLVGGWSTGSRAQGLQQPRLPGSRAQAQQLWCMGLAALWHVGSSRVRGETHFSCIGRRILYHWATKEPSQFPSSFSFFYLSYPVMWRFFSLFWKSEIFCYHLVDVLWESVHMSMYFSCILWEKVSSMSYSSTILMQSIPQVDFQKYFHMVKLMKHLF